MAAVHSARVPHVPATHNVLVPVLQVVPQAPQLVVLVFVSTHCPLHVTCPVGHAQTPAVQTSPARHWCRAAVVVQAPQLAASVAVSTH